MTKENILLVLSFDTTDFRVLVRIVTTEATEGMGKQKNNSVPSTSDSSRFSDERSLHLNAPSCLTE